MEELHCFPEFPGRLLCFHFIQNMALSWLIRMVRYLFPASTVQFAVNSCFMPKTSATFHYTWNMKNFCLFIDVSGQQNFAYKLVLGYKEMIGFNIYTFLLPSERKTKTVKTHSFIWHMSLSKSCIPALYRGSIPLQWQTGQISMIRACSGLG